MALVYIAEDDTDIRELETYALKSAGLSVESFPEGTSFLAAVKERLPDLVLLDIMLPGADGLQLLKRLRNDPETRSIPIIMVTAKTSEADKVKGLDSGADDYLSKPFGVMELVLKRMSSIEIDSSGIWHMLSSPSRTMPNATAFSISRA